MVLAKNTQGPIAMLDIPAILLVLRVSHTSFVYCTVK